MTEENKYGDRKGKYADEFLDHIDAVTSEVRKSYSQLFEMIKTKFFLVRDVYEQILIPKIDGTKATECDTSVTVPNRIKFESSPDAIMVYCSTDTWFSTTQGLTTAFRLGAGNHSISLRGDEWYFRAVATAGSLTIWGVV